MNSILNRLKQIGLAILAVVGSALFISRLFKKSSEEVLKENEMLLQRLAKVEEEKKQIDSSLKTEEKKQEELKKELGKESNESNEDLADYFNNRK